MDCAALPVFLGRLINYFFRARGLQAVQCKARRAPCSPATQTRRNAAMRRFQPSCKGKVTDDTPWGEIALDYRCGAGTVTRIR